MGFWGNTSNQQKQQKKFANISNDQINSNQQAVPVKYLAGRTYVAGDYITPAYNPKAKPVKTQSGKNESSTTGYKYFADFALMFCTGGRRPVDAVYKVIVDSDIRWTGNVQRGAADYETIAVEGLGTIYLYWGTETQPIDSTLLSPRGVPGGSTDPNDSTTFPEAPATGGAPTYQGMAAGDSDPYSGHYDKHPAYRGQCYGVFKNWSLGRDRVTGNCARVHPWHEFGARIHRRQADRSHRPGAADVASRVAFLSHCKRDRIDRHYFDDRENDRIHERPRHWQFTIADGRRLGLSAASLVLASASKVQNADQFGDFRQHPDAYYCHRKPSRHRHSGSISTGR